MRPIGQAGRLRPSDLLRPVQARCLAALQPVCLNGRVQIVQAVSPLRARPSTGAARRPRTGNPLFTRQMHVRLCLSGLFSCYGFALCSKIVVGAARFERATTALQTRDAARLHHAPIKKAAAPGSLCGPTWRSGWFAVLALLRSPGLQAGTHHSIPALRAGPRSARWCVGCGWWNWWISATSSTSGFSRFRGDLAGRRSFIAETISWI